MQAKADQRLSSQDQEYMLVLECGDEAVSSIKNFAKGSAIGGIFWLTVLLGLAMTDPMTRAVYAITD
jgi:hypothetical protein